MLSFSSFSNSVTLVHSAILAFFSILLSRRNIFLKFILYFAYKTDCTLKVAYFNLDLNRIVFFQICSH